MAPLDEQRLSLLAVNNPKVNAAVFVDTFFRKIEPVVVIPEIVPPVIPPPLEVIPVPTKVSGPNYKHDICSNCGVNSYHQNTTTFIHKNSDPKSVRCITICYNCLEKNTLTDD